MDFAELPTFPFGSFLLGACLLGCGSGGTTGAPSPDASATDSREDQAETAAEASTVADGVADGGDALDEDPDANGCADVRCAAPPPCDQPCTARCCCSRPSCPAAADGGVDGATPSVDAGPGDGAACADAGDCRLFSDMCGGCACLALPSTAADPVCPGPTSECLRDPCGGQSPACSGGHCVARMP